MKAFELVDARSPAEAVALLRRHAGRAQAFASGADLLYLMKDGVEGPALALPAVLVNLGEIEGLRRIRIDGSGLSLGAMVRLAEIVEHPLLRAEYSLLVQAAERVASPQLRNTSTVGGNLCQRPRCWYFRNPDVVCLKKGGSTCWAVEGDNRYYHAVLEGGPCHIVHPSDLAPALIALDARVSILGPSGTRTSPLEDFFVTTERDLHRENVLGPHEILTEIAVPRPTRMRQVFLKATVRQTGEFALSTVALSLRTERDVCRDSRVVLGGVSPRPLRSRSAEAVVAGKPLSAEVIRAAAAAAFADARPMSMNAYKVTLGEGLVRRAFEQAVAVIPSPGL
jgi:xanthine dehydrogenase YagS FAD-binding subunit